jgi:hypothetical protein
MILSAPFAITKAAVVKARKTSMITAVPVACLAPSRRWSRLISKVRGLSRLRMVHA